MKCRVCKSRLEFKFEGIVLKKYNVKYYHCIECGFVQTEYPYWIEEAYSDSIDMIDTGIMHRNLFQVEFTSIIIKFFFNKSKLFLDYGAGYGIFVRLMRDKGYDFYWQDKYSTNLLAKGFEIDNTKRFDLVTSYETLEHFIYPCEEISMIVKKTDSILITTELLPENVIPKLDDWNYYSPEAGQHISFFSLKTLKYIAKKFDMNLYSNQKNIHLLTSQKMSTIKFILLLKFRRVLFPMINLLSKKSLVKEDYEKIKELRS